MNQTKFITKESDALAEAYTTIDNLATRLFNDVEVEEEDTYRFLRSIATQINLYRVAKIDQKDTITLTEFMRAKRGGEIK